MDKKKYFESARSLLQQNEFGRAIDIYSALLNENILDFTVSCEMGNAQYLDGQYHKAIGSYYLSFHMLTALKLDRDGIKAPPKDPRDLKRLIYEADFLLVHLGMAVLTLQKNYQDALSTICRDPHTQMKKYREGLLGRGQGFNDDIFVQNVFNIGANFLKEGIAWDLIASLDNGDLGLAAIIYSKFGQFSTAA